MNGLEYEKLVAEYLKTNGYSKVELTKGTRDYGVDIIAHKGGKRYAVQCKYYSNPVNLKAVQEVVAGKAIYGCSSAIVVTNSTFRKSAKDLAKATNVILVENVTNSGSKVKVSRTNARVSFWVPYWTFVIAAFLVICLLALENRLDKPLHLIFLVLCVAVFPPIVVLFVRMFKKLSRQYTHKREVVSIDQNILEKPQPVPVDIIYSPSLQLPYFIKVNGINYRTGTPADISKFPLVYAPFSFQLKEEFFNNFFCNKAIFASIIGNSEMANALFDNAVEYEYSPKCPHYIKKSTADVICSHLTVSNFERIIGEAVAVVLHFNTASASFLQNKLNLDSQDISNILGELERIGIIASSRRRISKKILVTYYDILRGRI